MPEAPCRTCGAMTIAMCPQCRAPICSSSRCGEPHDRQHHPVCHVIHILSEGRSFCGMPGVPADWPEGHRFVPLMGRTVEDRKAVTCEKCLFVLLPEVEVKASACDCEEVKLYGHALGCPVKERQKPPKHPCAGHRRTKGTEGLTIYGHFRCGRCHLWVWDRKLGPRSTAPCEKRHPHR